MRNLLLQVVFDAAKFSTLIAGFVAPFITNITKNKLGVSSLAAYGIHIAVSVALAAGVLALDGKLSVGTLAEKATVIAFLATTLFQFLKLKSGLEVGPEDEVKPE